MSSLKQFTSNENIADEKDSLGGGGVLASGLYPATIKLAYVTKSKGGATGIVFHATTSENREIRETIYISSGDEKGNKNTYQDNKGETQYLPGFLLMQSIALLGAGKELAECETAEKLVNVYDYDTKKEVPTKVEMVMDLVNKPILLGVIKQVVDKTKLNESTKKYEPTGETREVNTIDKAFRASDRMTTAEIRGQAEKAEFADRWAAKWTGQVQDRSTKTAGAAGAPKAAGQAGAAAKPKSSLFA
jgi:hypothetical protein